MSAAPTVSSDPNAATGNTLVDNGVLGANGAQSQTTAIPGNDHIDANAQSAETTSVVDSGFAGAQGTQTEQTPGQMANDIKQDVAATPVLTPGAEVAQAIPGQAVPNEIPVSATNSSPEANATDAATDASQTTDAPATAGEQAPVTAATDDKDGAVATADDTKDKEEVKENQIAESVGVDSKIKDKVSGQSGTVTAMSDDKFTILLDGGETVERTLADLEDVSDEIEQNILKNEKPVDVNATAETTDANNENKDPENVSGTEGADTEKEPETMFVKATLNIDLGPFKAGDEVEVDATGYTSSGDDDAIKLKTEKDGVSEVPKKYLNVVDNKPSAEGETDADTKVASVLQQIADLETFLNDSNTKGSKAIEDAKDKIRKFAASLGKTEEKSEDDKPKEDAK
jgi:hypothetical protein